MSRKEREKVKRQILKDCREHDKLERRILLNARKLSDRALKKMGLAVGG